MTSYKICLEKTSFGKHTVEVMHDLAWAVIFVNGRQYEAPGNTAGLTLDHHDDKGTLTITLQRLLLTICTGRDPDKLSAEDRSGFDAWLRGEGKAVVAAYREALARAKWFWENPAELSDAVVNDVVGRWRGESNDYRKGVLHTFIPKSERDRLGIPTPPPLRRTEGGDLHVPF